MEICGKRIRRNESMTWLHEEAHIQRVQDPGRDSMKLVIDRIEDVCKVIHEDDTEPRGYFGVKRDCGRRFIASTKDSICGNHEWQIFHTGNAWPAPDGRPFQTFGALRRMFKGIKIYEFETFLELMTWVSED